MGASDSSARVDEGEGTRGWGAGFGLVGRLLAVCFGLAQREQSYF
jgi:hypothetical protein